MTRTRNVRTAFLAGSVLVGAVLVFALVLPEKPGRRPSPATHAPLSPSESVAEGVRTSDASRGLKVALSTCRFGALGAATVCDDPRITYDSTDGRTTLITGEHATGDTTAFEIDLVGDVRLKSGDVVIQTAKAHFSAHQHLVSSDGEVKLNAPGLNVTGDGFDVETDRQIVRLRSNVRTRIESSPRGIEGVNVLAPSLR